MKLFISWSGDASRQVAGILRDWIPTVIYSIEPWISSEDIEKGERWSIKLFEELDETSCGIICLTPTNLQSPWLNFEAGALSKSLERVKVFPFLFGLSPAELSGPLSLFQVTTFEKEDVLRLMKSLNKAQPVEVPVERLLRSFEISWPNLQNAINQVKIAQPPASKKGDTGSAEPEFKNIELSSAEVEILKAMASSKTTLVSDIIRATGFPEMKVEFCLQRLKDRGYISRTTGSSFCEITKEATLLLVDNNLL